MKLWFEIEDRANINKLYDVLGEKNIKPICKETKKRCWNKLIEETGKDVYVTDTSGFEPGCFALSCARANHYAMATCIV